MPLRRYHRRKAVPLRKRNVYRKRRIMRRRNKPSTLIYHPHKSLGSVVPDRYFTKLKYTVVKNIAEVSGTVDTVLKLNSIYDCGGTEDTTNAQGFSELAALYKSWRVHFSNIYINMCNAEATAGNTIICFPTNSSSAVPSSGSVVAGMIDLPYSKFRMVGGSSATPVARLKNSISTKRLLGLSNIQNQEDLVGSSTGDPSKVLSWYIRTYSTSGGTTSSQYIIRLIYYVEFFNRTTALNQT